MIHIKIEKTVYQLVAQLVKNSPAMWETWVQSLGLIPGLGRSPGEGIGCPLQYPGLENPMDYSGHCRPALFGLNLKLVSVTQLAGIRSVACNVAKRT